jgi:tRNA-specific 2-thiouridylase
MSDTKVLIAMSGGVDSSVAAHLMLRAGFDCAGATMRLCDQALLRLENTAPLDNADAQDVASRLGIPFYIFDNTAQFRAQVVDRFVSCYEQGGTPNPCVDCNRHLKFDTFLQAAISMGFSHIATGHYAKIRHDPASGRHHLYKAADLTKDQSYFLACLSQYQLSHTLFPLGELTKEQVRGIAQKQGFLNARKRDSQDICFIPDGDYRAFLERYTGKHYPVGDFLDTNGNVVGKHSGAVGYTIGQRKGLGIALGEPVYVCSKDMQANTVTVGSDAMLFRKTLRANNWNWIGISQLTQPLRCKARIRYRHSEQPATVYPEENGFVRVEFDEPQRAITAGQAVVLYDGDMVIGSGTITETI